MDKSIHHGYMHCAFHTAVLLSFVVKNTQVCLTTNQRRNIYQDANQTGTTYLQLSTGIQRNLNNSLTRSRIGLTTKTTQKKRSLLSWNLSKTSNVPAMLATSRDWQPSELKQKKVTFMNITELPGTGNEYECTAHSLQSGFATALKEVKS